MRKVCSVILGLCITLLNVNTAEAVEDSPSSRLTLKGLPGVIVSVPQRSGCESAGVYGQSIKAEVESQLQRAEITVLKTGQGPAVLRSVLSCFPVRSIGATAFLNIVRVEQVIPLPNMKSGAGVTTWHSEIGLGIGPRAKVSKDFRKEIRTRVDQFIKAWLSVNPK